MTEKPKWEQCVSCGIVSPEVTRVTATGNLLCPKCRGEGKKMLEVIKKTPIPATLQEVKEVFQKWLYLDSDHEVIDVIMACSIDRLVPGDPLWLMLISASGGTKTEIVRANTSDMAYTLDSLTAHTLISGKLEPDEEGNMVPVQGILPQLDGKVLIIKDFTLILGKRSEERDEIFSQLRAGYDGYLEYGYGTTGTPVRVHANFGLIAAVTPAVDHYGKLQGTLGERFLKIRHNPDRKLATEKALSNLGKEEEMRKELQEITWRLLDNFHKEPKKIEAVSPEVLSVILKLANATATLRTPVSINFYRYEINNSLTPSIEYPTRLSKQLLKLAICLALVRGKTVVSEEELKTVQRVAKDTVYPHRIKILEALKKDDQQYTTREIAEATEIPLSTCWRELKELEYLNVVKHEKIEVDHYGYSGTVIGSKHVPEKDGWTLLDPTLRILILPFGPLNGRSDHNMFVSLNTSGEGIGEKGGIKEKEGEGAGAPLVVSETKKASASLGFSGTTQVPKVPSSDSEDRVCGNCRDFHLASCGYIGDNFMSVSSDKWAGFLTCFKLKLPVDIEKDRTDTQKPTVDRCSS